MSLFIPLKRATLLIPSGPAHDPGRKHLFILLTDPFPDAESQGNANLVVNVCSVKTGIPHDGTCLLYEGDHDFIRHPSYIDYANARISETNKLLNGVNQNLFVPYGAIAGAVFARICHGVMQSRHSTPRIQQFFTRASQPRS